MFMYRLRKEHPVTYLSRTRPIHALAGLAILVSSLLVATPSAQAVPEVLKQAPKDSHMIFVVPSLSGLSGKVAMLKQQLDIPVPEMDDMLSSLKREIGMINGLDDNGSMMFVIPNLLAMMGPNAGNQPQFLMFMPVSDYAAFVGNYGGNGNDAVAELAFPTGEKGYSKSIAGYAVISPSKPLLDSYKPGLDTNAIKGKVGALGESTLDSGDLSMYVDMEAIAPVVLPMVDPMLNMALGQMQQQMGGADNPMMDLITPMYRLYGDAVKSVLSGAKGIAVGAQLSQKGLSFHKAFAMKPGSPLANTFTNSSADTSKLLAKLPSQSYIMAGSWDTKGMGLEGIINSVLAALPEDNAMVEVYRQALPLMAKSSGGATAFYTPTADAMMTGGFMNGLNLYQTSDTAGFITKNKEVIEKMDGMSMPLGQDPMGNDMGNMSFTTGYTSNALNIEGTTIDQYQMQFQMPPAMMQQMGPMAMMGGQGYNGYVAGKGDSVLMTTSTNTALLTEALKTSVNGGGIGASGTLATIRSQELPKNLVMETYVSMTGIAQTANLFMGMMGGPAINVPADVPPIASGIGVSDNTVSGALVVPMDTIKFVKDSVMQTMQNFGAAGR